MAQKSKASDAPQEAPKETLQEPTPSTEPAAPEDPDLEVSEDTEPAMQFEGQHYAGEHLSVTTSERLGHQVVEIKPIGWVGTGFEIPASRVHELIELLDEVEGLPGQE
jgi:hypothetical protein